MSFLPGMSGVVGMIGAGGAIPFTTLSHITSLVEDSSTTIDLPASIEPGDLLVLFQDDTEVFAVPPLVEPAGWTNALNVSNNFGFIGERVAVSYKIAVGNEDSTTITGMGGSKVLSQFRGDGPISSVSVQDVESQFTTGNPAAQTLSMSGGDVPLVGFGLYSAGNPVDPRTFTPAADGESGTSGGFFYVKYKIYNSSPANHSVDSADEGDTNFLASLFFELS